MSGIIKISLVRILFIVLLVDSRIYAVEKKVFAFGSSDPHPGFFAANIAAMQATPVDGTVFYAQNSSGVNFSYACWGTTTFSRSGMQYTVDGMNAVPDYGRFTENFLRFNVTPGYVDWFDDFSAITDNAGTAGWIVQQSKGVRGIMLDTEAYDGQLWEYTTRKYVSTKTFSQYQAQARQRGQEFMQAIQAEAPDATIIITHAYSSVWHYIGGNTSNLQSSSQALLPAFLDGMVAVAGPGIKLVDGNIISFRFKTLQEFLDGRQATLSGVLPIVQNPTSYANKFGVAFATWMNPPVWYSSPSQFNLNYFTPGALKTAMQNGLNVADQYAWIYGESLHWWNANGTPNIPSAYSDAIASAKAMANSTKVPMPLLFDAQFTGDTVAAAPSVGSATAGGVSTKPTSLAAGSGNSILVQNAYTDSATSNVFGTGKVAVIKDLSSSNTTSLNFQVANSDAGVPPSGLVNLSWDMMVDSAHSGGDYYMSFFDNAGLQIGGLLINLATPGSTANIYFVIFSPAGSYVSSSTLAGSIPYGTGVNLEVRLDFATGKQSLYVNGTPQSTTANFATNTNFSIIQLHTTGGALGTIAIDNMQIAVSKPKFDVKFTGDTVAAAPSVGSAVAGGVSTNPTSLTAGLGNSILVQNTYTDSVTSNVFGASGKVAVIKDLSSSSTTSLNFQGASSDAIAPPCGVAGVQWDMIVDSAHSGGDFYMSFFNDSGAQTGGLVVNLATAGSTANMYFLTFSPPGTYVSSTFAGSFPYGKSVNVEARLDYITGKQALYLNGSLQGPTANFATTGNSFSIIQFYTTPAALGTVAIDNFQVVVPRPKFDVVFTDDTVAAAPGVGMAVAGGVATKPTLLAAGSGTSILVQSSYTDSVTSNVFGTGKVAVIEDLSSSNTTSLNFQLASSDAVLPRDVVGIGWNMMVDSAHSGGDYYMSFFDNNGLQIGGLVINLATAGSTANIYFLTFSPAGTYVSSTLAGSIPYGTSVKLETRLDFSTGKQSLYLNDVLQIATANFATNTNFAIMQFHTNAGAQGTVAIDNFQINPR